MAWQELGLPYPPFVPLTLVDPVHPEKVSPCERVSDDALQASCQPISSISLLFSY